MTHTTFRPFQLFDTHGIPLEMILKHAVAAGLPLDWVVLLFVSDALRAGWKKTKIQSELRELRLFGFAIAEEWFNTLP